MCQNYCPQKNETLITTDFIKLNDSYTFFFAFNSMIVELTSTVV